MRRLALLLVAFGLSGCAGSVVLSPPGPHSDGWRAVEAHTRTLGLGLPGGAYLAPGVRFAGGVQVLTPSHDRLHSLSDLKVVGGDFVSVSDWGDLFRFTPRLDRRGRLTGLGDIRMRPLTGLDGEPFPTKSDGDAEGLAVTADGELLVSFEGDHRIWSYGPLAALADRPVRISTPAITASSDVGLEGLAAAPGGWRAAGEGGGVWDCTPAACTAVSPPPATEIPVTEWRNTGLDRDPSGAGWFVVRRIYRAPIDMRGQVRRMAPDGALGPVLVELRLPSTVDNFEGIAAVARPDGGVRLYILSDDNGNPVQKTLMLAFDVAN